MNQKRGLAANLAKVVSLVVLTAIIAGCEAIGIPTAAPHPAVEHAVEVREGADLRSDRAWVEQVMSDPTSVEWNGIRVTPEELEFINARESQRELADEMHMRESIGLPADEATVVALLADPTAVRRSGILMSAREAAAWDARVDNQAKAEPTIRGYGQRFPDAWAGLTFDADGTAIAFFTRDLEIHRAALRRLFVEGTVRYEVRQAQWTLRELEALRSRIRGSAWFAEHGIKYRGGGIREAENRVEVIVEIPAPDPDIELDIATAFDAVGMVRASVTVQAPWTGGYGDMGVTVLDQAGQPASHVDCEFKPLNPTLNGFDFYAYVTTAETGVCNARHLAATAYRLTITDGFQGPVLHVRDVTITKDQADAITITVPLPLD